jgi:rubrerythrin
MTSEQQATLSGLQTAIRMEIDGKEFYLKSAKASRQEQGTKLFNQLAAEEDIHQQVFTKIYDKIQAKQQWPAEKVNPHGADKLKTVFKDAIAKLGKEYAPAAAEIDAVKTGMAMENKTLDFYRERGAKAAFPAEKQLYEAFAMQESTHFSLLQDYYEFLTSPADYFSKKEHWSLDG